MKEHENYTNVEREEIEESKSKKQKDMSDEDRWKELVTEYSHSNYIIQSEFGTLDMSDDAMEDIYKGENLTYEEYLQALFNSRNNRRECFEQCYYRRAWCDFKGQISIISRKKKKIMFERVYVLGDMGDGTLYSGKEEHVWMDLAPFKEYKVGDRVSFDGEIYRYLKTGHGKQISFGICNTEFTEKIESYELPTDEEMTLQAVNQILCEVCLYNEQCNRVICYR